MTKMKKSLLSWSLRFRNVEMEKQFIESKLEYQRIIIEGTLIVGLLMVVLSFSVNPFNQSLSSFNYLFYKLMVLVSVVPLLLISRKKAKYRENILILIFTGAFIFLCETRKSHILRMGIAYVFTCGMSIELLLLAITVSKIGFIRRTLLIIVFNALNCFIYLPFEENYSESYFPFYHICLNLLSLLVFSYVIESYDRKVFFEVKKKERNLVSFKGLIDDLFPSPIAIVQNDSLIFENKEALNSFNCRSKEELIACFKKFKIQKLTEEIQSLNIEKSESNILLERVEGSGSSQNFENVWDITKKYRLLKSYSNSGELKSFRSFITDPSRRVKTYYDVKVKTIDWDNKAAILMIFSENKLIQRIHKLKEEAFYKDRLLANVSHELRTPLNGVIGMLESTLGLIREKNIRKKISIALRSSKYLLSTVNDILDFHQISNNEFKLNYQIFSLPNLIEEVSKLVKFQAKLKQISFKIDNKIQQENSKAIIRSDPNRIKQVMLNLLGNALKFTEKGSITVSIEKNKNKEYNDFENICEYLIKVTDTGIGIKEEDKKYLFKLFEKLESKEKENANENGIGLGLAISQNLVMILNNKKENYNIMVESQYGKGSCFYFPLISGLDEIGCEDGLKTGMVEDNINQVNRSSFSPKKKNNIIMESQEQLKILVVDDDQINIIVAKSFLDNSGLHNYDIALNGLEALQKIKTNAKDHLFYDLILMDCNMPIMDGFKATQEIRKLVNKNKIPDLKIIACTANASQQDHDQCFQAGMNEYISKPFSRRELVNKINGMFS